MKVNQHKFRELILYLSARSSLDPKFGATKLNKLLYFCDFLAYVKLGKPITGAGYFRLPKGPAPKCLLPVRQEMIDEGILEIKRVTLADGKIQDRPVAKRTPNMGRFTQDEMAHIDGVIAKMWDMDSDNATDLSHEDVGWQVMRDQETIPYGIAFFSNPPLTEEEKARARHIAKLRRVA